MLSSKSLSRNSYKSSLVEEETRALTAKQLAEILQMSQQVIYRLSRAGEIPCLKIGKKTIRFELNRVKQALMAKKAITRKDKRAPLRKEIGSFQYVTLDDIQRKGKAKLRPRKNLKLERFKIIIPNGVDITTLAYERNKY